MAGVTRPEVPIMIKRVGEPTLALRSFIHKFSSHRVPRARARERERKRERERESDETVEKAKREKERNLARQACAPCVPPSCPPRDEAACPLISTTYPDAFFFVSLRDVVTSVVLDVHTHFSDRSLYGRSRRTTRDNRMIERVDARQWKIA